MSGNPPPQPWLFSYLWPSDCLKARFVLPTIPVQPSGVPLTGAPNPIARIPPVPTGIPFVIATDLNQTNNPIKVILTNLPHAQLVYTRDLSQVPDQWDPMFLNGSTALLGAYFLNALARNAAQYNQQVALSKSLIDEARRTNADESISQIDHMPDWLQARRIGGYGPWGNCGGYGNAGVGHGASYDQVTFPCGLFY